MKLTRAFVGFTLIFSIGFISFLALPAATALAQENSVALQRGYRTGYSDGYMAGYRDAIDSKSKDFKVHDDYTDANRAYSKDYGPIEEYSDGYRQGFESGYDTGFEKRGFDSTVPAGLSRREANIPTAVPAPPAEVPATTIAEKQPAPAAETQAVQATPVNETQRVDAITTTQAVENQKVSYKDNDDSIVIPRDMELIIELQTDLSTGKNKPGDRFTAKVVSPAEVEGAIIEGRIDKIVRPGRIKRRSELSLTFDRLVMSENRWGNIAATLTEVLPIKGDNVKMVDPEGTAIGKSSIKSDTIKVGAATGTGTVIGAVAGGPVGAAVGAGVGAAFGVGAVVIQRGKDVNLLSNQQLRLKTDLETKIR
jgi:hypothetical protein